MSDKPQRLSKLAKEFNVGVDTILEFLVSKEVGDLNRNSKVSADVYEMLVDEYQPDMKVKAEAKQKKEARLAEEDAKQVAEEEVEIEKVEAPTLQGLKVVAKVDLEKESKPKKEEKVEEVKPKKKVVRKKVVKKSSE